MELNKIYNMDCLEGMAKMPENSVDMILCDLPYGVTNCKWDNIIPFPRLWEQYNRVAKENAAILLFGVQPFTTKIIQSNFKNFRYCWYWQKNNKTGGQFARVQPMRCIEDICVFYKKKPTYNPQGLVKLEKPIFHEKKKSSIYSYRGSGSVQRYKNYPCHLLKFAGCGFGKEKRLHPTQKPLELCEYLIKTYTDENNIVLDNCAGSGTSLIAAKNTGRQYVGFETNRQYYDIAVKRLA